MKRWPDGSPRLPLSRCAHCGKRLDAASLLEGDSPPPRPGDLSVCFGCGEVLRFNASLRLRRMSAIEIAGLDPEEAAELLAVQRHVRRFLASQ